MNSATVAQFYQALSKDNLDQLPTIYHDDVVFEDSAHHVEGINALSTYFTQLYENVEQCQFEIEEQHDHDDVGFLVWRMTLIHPKLNSGKRVIVPGVTHLKFQDGKVIFHRDYFDMGQMLYEQLPILGSVIQFIKRKLGQ